MTADEVILVDEHDTQTGVCEKLKAHKDGLLHRAISVFVFKKTGADDYEVLLQKRNKDKYHSGGLWSNTCCSHPRPGENTTDAAHRRLKEEMGFDVPLQYAGSFKYKADFPNRLTEHEMDHVYIGFYDDQPIKPDPAEACDYKWVDTLLLLIDMDIKADEYTAWFNSALSIALNKITKLDQIAKWG